MWEGGSSRNLDITFQECNSMIPYLPFLMGNQFDIQAYADKYPTRTKIIRLLALAHHCHGRNDDREIEALKIAYKEAKKGKDVQLFATVIEKINGRLYPEYDMDEDWCNEVIRNWEENRVRLGEEASKCQDDYEKGLAYAEDDTKAACKKAANMFYMHGEADAARVWYLAAIRYCRVEVEYWEMFMRFVLLFIEWGNFPRAQYTAIEGLKHKHDFNMDSFTENTLHSTIGLTSIRYRSFTHAALRFLQTGKEVGNQFSMILADHDIATYGALCTLATFEQEELQDCIFENKDFQSYLDSMIEVKELLHDFCSRDYSSVFRHLANLREWLLFDIHLFDRFEELHEKIRKKAIVQYVRPFSVIDLKTMAEIFNTSVEDLKKELVTLILDDQIKAKIDSIENVLHVRTDDTIANFKKLLERCSEIERDARTILLFNAVFNYPLVRNEE
ncbi:COP9 signalosome complex subunit 1-like [Cucurbita moschata]|uniref:COP9 signalosome complex subunit 1-like n=1 Tax=Cucurbita moschata TaxID=3662 RepID=A0A6J1HJ20_CUCMO|nr:COP9 signalosome complex subunit 1-like [Cucurbita moschata]